MQSRAILPQSKTSKKRNSNCLCLGVQYLVIIDLDRLFKRMNRLLSSGIDLSISLAMIDLYRFVAPW